MFVTGFRTYKVINYTSGLYELDPKGSFVYVEVTAGADDITFQANIFPEHGLADGGGIPIKAGETRKIPLQLYNFQASGACTVVAYRM